MTFLLVTVNVCEGLHSRANRVSCLPLVLSFLLVMSHPSKKLCRKKAGLPRPLYEMTIVYAIKLFEENSLLTASKLT